MSPLSSNDLERVSLCEALDRILNKGAVVVGEVTIAVANIDLVYLGLRVILTSMETALESKSSPVVRPCLEVAG
jgi:gas vesicle structural protein